MSHPHLLITTLFLLISCLTINLTHASVALSSDTGHLFGASNGMMMPDDNKQPHHHQGNSPHVDDMAQLKAHLLKMQKELRKHQPLYNEDRFAVPLMLHQQQKGENKWDPDIGKTAPELIAARSYPVEVHHVTTPDSYILALHRIPRKTSDKNSQRKGTVFLQHGLIDSSNTWVNNFQNQSLAYRLYDEGYDVWLGNVRGNYYSNASTKYDPSQDEFWDFSWDEHALIDLPTVIKYIVSVTEEKQMHLVGHSQGTTMSFAALSHPKTKAFMDEHIISFTALAPVATPRHVSGLLRALAVIHFDKFVHLFGHGEFLLSTHLLEWLLPDLCEYLPHPLCRTIICSITGCNFPSVNQTRLPVYVSYTPAGTSVRNMAHWSQMVLTGSFQMYDYGSASKNDKHYNQPVPPKYDLSKVEVPVAIMYGGVDTLAVLPDVENLIESLNPKYVRAKKFLPLFGHLDFTWGITQEVNNPVLEFIEGGYSQEKK